MNNLDYVRKREALIPEAEEYANKKMGNIPTRMGRDRDNWYINWNLNFHGMMEKLCRDRGVYVAGNTR